MTETFIVISSIKHYFSLYFLIKVTLQSAGLLRIGQAIMSAEKLCIGGLGQFVFSSAINLNNSELILCGSVASTLLAAVFRVGVWKQLLRF